jgi:hypothetical protein
MGATGRADATIPKIGSQALCAAALEASNEGVLIICVKWLILKENQLCVLACQEGEPCIIAWENP